MIPEPNVADIRTQPIASPSAWTAGEMAKDASWKYRLTDAELFELDAALRAVNDAGIPLHEIARENFVLPAFSVRIAGWLDELSDGRGFALIRGFPVERYGYEDARRLYWGFMSHLGIPVSQNSYGDLIDDIWAKQTGVVANPNGTRIYNTTQELTFHTDRCDLVGLLCLRPAKEGGLSCILSTMTLYNRILAENPEYLAVLHRGFIYTNVEEGADGAQYRVPVYTVHDGVVSCRFQRNVLARAIKNGVPFTDLELETLAYCDKVMASDDLRLDMDFERGDIQLVNNFTIAHARTSFVDDPDPELRRHLLRMWLKLRGRRPIGPYFGEYDGVPKILSR